MCLVFTQYHKMLHRSGIDPVNVFYQQLNSFNINFQCHLYFPGLCFMLFYIPKLHSIDCFLVNLERWQKKTEPSEVVQDKKNFPVLSNTISPSPSHLVHCKTSNSILHSTKSVRKQLLGELGNSLNFSALSMDLLKPNPYSSTKGNKAVEL